MGLRRPSTLVAFALLAGALTISTATPAGAAAGPPAPAADLFTCWVSPLTVAARSAPAVTHPQRCVEDRVGGAQGTHTAGNVSVQAVDATGRTAPRAAGARSTTRGGLAEASATSARIVVGRTLIELGAISSRATIRCTYDTRGAHLSYSGTSSVASLRINGHVVPLRDVMTTIRVPGGRLRLNHSEVGPTGLVQHAVMLDTASAHVVIGEAAVAFAATAGNPCRR